MDIIPSPLINIELDSQWLSSLMSCGRMTKMGLDEGHQAKGGKSVSLEMGSIVHHYLEYMYKHLIDGKKKSEAIAYGMSAAISYSKSKEVTNCTGEDIALALDTCIQYENRYKNDAWRPIEIETVKSKEIYVDDKIRILWKAKFDAIMDTGQMVLPVDHKTMKQRRDTLNLNNQFTGQVEIMGTRRMFVNKVGFQTSLKLEDRMQRVPLYYSLDRLQEWTQEIVPYWAYKLVEYTETGYWPPNFTHCENKYGFCKFKEVCEANRNMRLETLKNDFIVGERWDIGNDD